jgi:hypothetical protein
MQLRKGNSMFNTIFKTIPVVTVWRHGFIENIDILPLFHMAEYCDTPQLKERSNREYKVCLNGIAILRLLDQRFMASMCSKVFSQKTLLFGDNWGK